MLLLLLFSILAVCTIAEIRPQPWITEPAMACGVFAGVMAALLVSRAAISSHYASAFRHRPRQQLAPIARQFGWVRWVDAHLGLLVIPFSIYATGWSQIVKDSWGLGEFFLLDDLAVLAPLLLSLLHFWWVQTDVEVAIHSRDMEGPCEVLRLERFWTRIRQHGGFVFAPTGLALLVAETYEHFDSQLSGYAWLTPLFSLLMILFLFPLMLCWIWPTAPLAAGPLRQRLEQAIKRTRIRVREILVWRTSDSLVNAAVVGFAGVFRYILLTDALLDRMSDEEIEAVLLHEAAHVRRRHLPVRMGLISFPLVMWAIAAAMLMQDQAGALTELHGWMQRSLWASMLAPLVACGYFVASLGWISRLLEFDADLWASGQPEIEGAHIRYVQMLERLAEAGGVRRDRRGWLHPSIDERIAFVLSASESAGSRRAFQAQLRATYGAFLMIGLAAPFAAWLLARCAGY